MLENQDTAQYLAEIATGNLEHKGALKNLLHWPLYRDMKKHPEWRGKALMKKDPFCKRMERDIDLKKAYILSSNTGQGKPPTSDDIKRYIAEQQELSHRAKKLDPPIKFRMKLEDFPLTKTGRRNITTSKNIVYLYDSWFELRESLCRAYPRLKGKLSSFMDDLPVFVFVCNSLAKGRLFGDPFTGELAAYSMAFGKFDEEKRMVLAYYPHQMFNQLTEAVKPNKGIHIVRDLVDLAVFYGGVAVDVRKNEAM